MTVPSASLENRTQSGRRTVSEPPEYTVCLDRSKKTSRVSPVGCLCIFRPSRNVIRWPYRIVAKSLQSGYGVSPTPPGTAISIFPLGCRHRCRPSGNAVHNRPSSQCISVGPGGRLSNHMPLLRLRRPPRMTQDRGDACVVATRPRGRRRVVRHPDPRCSGPSYLLSDRGSPRAPSPDRFEDR